MTNTTFSHYWCVHTDVQVKVGPKMTHLLKKMEHGYPLLQAPAINKGDAFTQLERDAQGLQVCVGGFEVGGRFHSLYFVSSITLLNSLRFRFILSSDALFRPIAQGLLPPVVRTMKQQVERAKDALASYGNPLHKYQMLMALLDANETVFYRLIIDNVELYMPIIYTPTVGLACQKYGDIWQRPRGMFLSIQHRGRVRQVIHIHINARLCSFVYVHICACVCVHACVCVCVCVCVFVYRQNAGGHVCVSMYTYMYICGCVCEWMCTSIAVSMYVCVYVYIHIYI